MSLLRRVVAASVLLATFSTSASLNRATAQVAKGDGPLPAGALARFSAPKGEWIRPVGFAADGRTLVLWTKYAVLLGDLETGKSKTLLEFPATPNSVLPLHEAALSPDGKILVTNTREFINGGLKYVFTYWSVPAGGKVDSFEHLDGDAYSWLSLSCKGDCLSWNTKLPCVYVRRDFGSNAQIQKIPTTTSQVTSAFSADGAHLAVSFSKAEGYQVQIWETATMRQTIVLTEMSRSSSGGLAFSPDGNSILVAGLVLDVWDLKTKKISHRIPQRGSYPRWLPDGAGLAVCTAIKGSSIPRLLEAATGEEICEFHGHAHQVGLLAVAARGKVLASGDLKEVLVWDLQMLPGYQIQKGAKLAPKQLTDLWQDLDAKSSTKGYRALLQLAQGGSNVVDFLEKHLTPAAAKDAKQIDKLVKDLGSESFPQREKATKALKDLGRMVEVDLQKALSDNPPAEARERLEKLLENLKQRHLPGELRQHRAICVLERIGSEASKELLQKLAAGASWSAVTNSAQSALERLARWEKQTTSK